MTLNSTGRPPRVKRNSFSVWRPFAEPGIILRVFGIRGRRPRPPDLPEHLRRDIGIPVEHRTPDWWELR